MKNLICISDDSGSIFGPLDAEPNYRRLGVEYDKIADRYFDSFTQKEISKKEITLRESEISYDC